MIRYGPVGQVVEGEAIGALDIVRRTPGRFTDQQIRLLETFGDQAVIAIENARPFFGLGQRNAELHDSNRRVAEALEREIATAEVLRVIASSPADAQVVLDAVGESAARLVEADLAAIHRVDSRHQRCVAATLWELVGATQPCGRGTVNGRSMLDRETIQAFEPELEYRAKYPESRMHELGFHSQLVTPLLREGTPIGTLVVQRKERRPFVDQQIALLKTLADQAVIAIENSRLFEQLQNHVGELAPYPTE